MAPVFSKVDYNKLCYDVQNKVTLIYAKFGKDLFIIFKVIPGLQTVAPIFLAYPLDNISPINNTCSGHTYILSVYS